MNNLKVIYLASGKAVLKYDNVIYNDLLIKRDIQCDMMSVDLTPYDILIATPPCNYWSRANCNIYSKYSQLTKDLLPNIINKFYLSGKPFIVENVINKKRMSCFMKDLPIDIRYIEYGRHSYFTNILTYIPIDIPQVQDFKYGGVFINKFSDRQGGVNVNLVLDDFINYVLNI